MTESVSPFKAMLCKEWFKNVHLYEPEETCHNIRLSEEYSIHSWCKSDCLTLHQHVHSHNLEIETDINDIFTDNEFLTISLDTGIRIQIPIEKLVKTTPHLKVNKESSLCGYKQKNELPSFDVFGLQVLQHGGNSPSLEQNKEQPSLNVFGLIHLQRGGSSPVSTYFLYQPMHASTACDLLANLLDKISLSIHSTHSGSTVTFRCGLFSTLIYTKIVSQVININETQYTFILLSCRMGVSNDKNNSISESYGSVHSSAGKDSIQWNNSRDSLHRGLSFGYVHRRTEIDHRRQSESGNNNIHRSDIQIGNREEACA